MALYNSLLPQIQFHPSFFCLFALVCGICIQAYFPFQMLSLVALFFGFLIVGFLFFKKNRWCLFVISTFFFGMISYAYREKQHQNVMNNFGNQACDLVATILDKNEQKNTHAKEVLTLHVQEFYERDTTAKQDVNFTCTAYIQQPCAELTVGDTIKISDVFLKNTKNQRYAFYLLKEGIATSFFVHDRPFLVERPNFSLRRWCFEIKHTLLQRLKTKMSHSCFSFFNSLFLGNRSCDKKYFASIKERFKYWGLAHYLARSGLHLIIFLMCWTFLLRLIPLAQPIKTCILLGCCFIYFFLSWSNISFTRAFITYIAYALYTLTRAQINPLHVLSVITLCLLAINPFHLFFLDFQLSFGLTFALACIHNAKCCTTRA